MERLWVWVLAVVVLTPLLWSLTRSDASMPAKDPDVDPTAVSPAALEVFLAQGPTLGLWETERLVGRQRAYFAPLPGQADRIVMAPAPVGPDESYCKTCKHPCSYSRRQVLRFFFEAPAELFLANYRIAETPSMSHVAGRPAVVYTWRPRFLTGLLTEREAFFDPRTGALLQVEDYNDEGVMVRRVRHVSPDTGRWDPSRFDPKRDPICRAPDPTMQATAEDLADLQEEIPFSLATPTWLPRGYRLVRAEYREVPTDPTAEPGEAPATPPARMATLLYSDGLGLLSLAVAPPADMDAIEAVMRRATMPEGRDEEGVGVESACPGLPAEPRDIRMDGHVLRVRRDRCRTVMRRDDLPGLSVSLLARNELPLDEYLDVLASVRPFDPEEDATAGTGPR